ncbi:pre-mRNA splicing factor component-domain-containing protein [Tuber brumale]|nr:pre-mRNA splicing factor component-domain-containing protein [Tuber brumale]
MPVVKGGVWTNVEDEILKASVSKYGLNQWQRVSSLLARKSAKQCKARWAEWLDPSIRKVEWSRDEDEKLLHLAKLMPTQWRTIAPIVGRTATQCLDRYQKLLDEAEARESSELGLAGPDGAEASAPSADDIRRFRPGETDPDPETKPARPDAVDMDEDEKEMLSEARARLANTQGKKAKRKARERQLEDSRRLAVLQKRRELKHAGINIKLTNRRRGEMDYNADIPFEKKPALGFYDISEEEARNERQRANIDPRKALSHTKRKGDQDEDLDRKRRKGGDKDKNGAAAAFASAAKAGQLQKIRQAEQLSKRRQLVLPSPQVGETELEDIVKMGLMGEDANKIAGASDNESTKGLVGSYTNINTGAPIRTPRAPPTEDRVANEIKNIRALTETQSSLLGGENTPLHESGTTGFDGIAPRKMTVSTPNPLATPFRASGVVDATPGATPGRPGQTPLRTPRDSLAINQNGAYAGSLVSMTPGDQKLQQNSIKQQLRSGFASLPKPKEIELEEPEEPEEDTDTPAGPQLVEDREEIDRRNRERAEAEAAAELKRRTQVIQKFLPRPRIVDIGALLEAEMSNESNHIQKIISQEMATLIGTDALRYPIKGGKATGAPKTLEKLDDDLLEKARMEIVLELSPEIVEQAKSGFEDAWLRIHSSPNLPGLEGYGADEEDSQIKTYDFIQEKLIKDATQGNKLEKKLALHLGGYQARSKMLCQKLIEASEAIAETRRDLEGFRALKMSETTALPKRLEGLRKEVAFLDRREREAQEVYRTRKEELESL